MKPSAISALIAVILVVSCGIAAMLDKKAANTSSISVAIFGAKTHMGQSSPCENDFTGGHIDFTVLYRFSLYRVVFVDRGFDGTLDEVRITENKGGDEYTIIPANLDESSDDQAVRNYLGLCSQFAEIRAEAASPG